MLIVGKKLNSLVSRIEKKKYTGKKENLEMNWLLICGGGWLGVIVFTSLPQAKTCFTNVVMTGLAWTAVWGWILWRFL